MYLPTLTWEKFIYILTQTVTVYTSVERAIRTITIYNFELKMEYIADYLILIPIKYKLRERRDLRQMRG